MTTEIIILSASEGSAIDGGFSTITNMDIGIMGIIFPHAGKL